MTINQILEENLHLLQNLGVETSKSELRMLLAFVLKTDISTLRFYSDPLTSEQEKHFAQLVEMRAKHWPVDKIIGQKGFYKYDFSVNCNVLSPRPDTEIIVESAITLLKKLKSPKILELGVGSGCILLSLLAEIEDAKGVGIDISNDALSVAKQNAAQMHLLSQVKLEQTDWFDNKLSETTGNEFDMIVSNPPYIPSKDISSLDDEVKNYDPLVALDGGADGLRDYRQIVKIAPCLLKNNGYLIFEGGKDQARDIAQIGISAGFTLVDIVQDLNYIERCIILKK